MTWISGAELRQLRRDSKQFEKLEKKFDKQREELWQLREDKDVQRNKKIRESYEELKISNEREKELRSLNSYYDSRESSLKEDIEDLKTKKRMLKVQEQEDALEVKSAGLDKLESDLQKEYAVLKAELEGKYNNMQSDLVERYETKLNDLADDAELMASQYKAEAMEGVNETVTELLDKIIDFKQEMADITVNKVIEVIETGSKKVTRRKK